MFGVTRKSYLPADLEPYALHSAAFHGQTSVIQELLATGRNPYEPIQEGETALHVALAEDQKKVVNVLFETHKHDFELVGDYLVQRYQHDPEDRFWINTSILVAATEDQCLEVKKWEHLESDAPGNPKDGVLVLLRHPIDGQHAAVLKSNANRRIQLVKLINTIFKNGFLSWMSTGPGGYCQTLLNLLASEGYVEHLETLIEFGVDLNTIGLRKQTPFLAACQTNQIAIIDLLLTKYSDRFNPLAVDNLQQNGLHYVLYRNHHEIFQFTLEALINYRIQHCNESRSEAFNSLFNYQFNDFPDTSVWSFLDGQYWNEYLEKVCDEFQYDVSYQWKNVTVLVDMIHYNKVRQYCKSQILGNRQLLELSSKNGCTVLHALIAENELDFVKDFYSDNLARMQSIFECDAVYQTIYTVMHRDYFDMLEFILEKHYRFLQLNLNQIDTRILKEYTSSNYDKGFSMLEHFMSQIEPFTRLRKKELDRLSESTISEYDAIYERMNTDFSTALEEIKSSGKTIDDYNIYSGRCFLHQSITQDRLKMTEQLLNSGVDIDYLDADERHAIHHVKSVEMLHLLLRHHPERTILVHRKDSSGFTLFHILCMENATSHKEKLILELLQLGVKIDERTNDQATVLHHINDEALFLFLTRGVEAEGITGIDVDLRDSEGNTALHRHLQQQNGVIAAAMIQSADGFVSFNDSGDSYLAFLVRFDRETFNTVFKPILEANPDRTNEMFEAELATSKEQASKLFVEACSTSNEFCIKRMLQMDLDFNILACGGMTALLFLTNSYETVDPSIVKQLLEKNVDVNLSFQHGRSALHFLGWHFTRMKNQGFGTDMVRCIIDKDAEINSVDEEGNSALHYAFQHTELDFVIVMLEHGADWNLINRSGKHPYEEAPRDICDIISRV